MNYTRKVIEAGTKYESPDKNTGLIDSGYRAYWIGGAEGKIEFHSVCLNEAGRCLERGIVYTLMNQEDPQWPNDFTDLLI